MSLIVTTIPEDDALLAGWLERQLVGLDLARLVAELSAVHGPGPTQLASVTTVLASHLDRIYESGLSHLTRPLLQRLLTNPRLLLELQALVLQHGGAFWDARARDEAIDAHVARGRQRLGLTRRPAVEAPALPWYGRVWIVGLATAAAVLLTVTTWNAMRAPQSAGWGWGRPGALPANVTASAYFGKLADAAEEWFKKRPESSPELARRIGQLRQGCSTLILAAHAPLSKDERAWLTERCRKWAAKFDQQLVDLEAGKPAAEVRDATDATVRQLVKTLRERADVS